MPDVDSKLNKLKKLSIAMMIVSFLGFIDATYLTITQYLHATVPCTITHGCDIVLKSSYSHILGFPISIFGIAFYLTIFFGAYFYWEYRSRSYFKITAFLTAFGFLFSVWLVYLQLIVLNAICQYCMLSATTSTILFGLGLGVLKTVGSFRSLNADVQE